jgi:endoglucanase
MNVASRTTSALMLTALATWFCSCSNSSTPSPPTPATSTIDDVTISNNQLMKGGTPWIPHGYYMIAFEASPTHLDPTEPWWNNAYLNYTPQEFADMKAAGADSVRMQVAQPGMDPANEENLYSETYSNQAIAAVKAARAAGLTVILSVQDESQSGETTPETLPNATTQRVWNVLTPIFGKDKGVLFELFNEPSPVANAANWQAWAAAMNTMIQTVRLKGSENVIVADGLASAQALTGAPALTDTMNEVLYASHPYVNAQEGEAGYKEDAWNEKFGNFAATHPVLISEWGEGYFHNANTEAETLTFFAYLQGKNIGLEAGIWDWIGANFATVRVDYPTMTAFSTYLQPNGSLLPNTSAGWGPGKTIVGWYTTGVLPAAPQ